MHDSPGTASYSLKLSERERMRYRVMAANAADNEAAECPAAGIAPGTRMADVGCGPGAVLRLLAERVGAEGGQSASTPIPRRCPWPNRR